MIRWIVGTSLKLRYIVLLIAAALMVYGLVQLPNTPLDVFPEFAPPRVEIQTPSLGLSADEVESLITVPLEQAFSGVEGLDLMRSKSIPDLSSIELLFKPGSWCKSAWQSRRLRCRPGPPRPLCCRPCRLLPGP